MSNLIPPPPQSSAELYQRAAALSGVSLGEVAKEYNLPLPKTALHGKGWIGKLLELALGANAGCLPEPDFLNLGIELKTLPVTVTGRPRETTYVCHIPLMEIHKQQWETSTVYKKLRHVLWVPIESDPGLNFTDRRIGSPLLWQPNAEEENLLRHDWEELTERIIQGRIETITARIGKVLQIRPKGANASALCNAINENGEIIKTLPRGFYLRTEFTANIISTHFII